MDLGLAVVSDGSSTCKIRQALPFAFDRGEKSGFTIGKNDRLIVPGSDLELCGRGRIVMNGPLLPRHCFFGYDGVWTRFKTLGGSFFCNRIGVMRRVIESYFLHGLVFLSQFNDVCLLMRKSERRSGMAWIAPFLAHQCHTTNFGCAFQEYRTRMGMCQSKFSVGTRLLCYTRAHDCVSVCAAA